MVVEVFVVWIGMLLVDVWDVFLVYGFFWGLEVDCDVWGLFVG